MEKKEYTKEELRQISQGINVKYFMTDIMEIRDQFLKLSEEDLEAHYELKCVVCLIHILSGRLEEAKKIIDGVTPPVYQSFLYLIYPPTDDISFDKIIQGLQTQDIQVPNLTFSAGRPSFINGFKDFSRYSCYYLKKNKDSVIQMLETLYGSLADVIYDVGYAEKLYYENKCLDALVLITGAIPKLEKAGDMRCLFVALYLQMKILLVNGQIDSVDHMSKEIRSRLTKTGSAELTYNLDALDAYVALFEGDLQKINEWLTSSAPNEYEDFMMLDVYPYLIKMRCYLLTGKYMALISLSEKLRPLFRSGHRRMDLCKIDMIVAMAGFQTGKIELAYESLERSLKDAKRYKYDRLIGDEGNIMYKLLMKYKKDNPSSRYIDYVNQLIEIARNVAINYPDYLVVPERKKINLTDIEKSILQLLSQGKSYDEMAAFFEISVNTVRYHIKNIYNKLEVNSGLKALAKAKTIGLI